MDHLRIWLTPIILIAAFAAALFVATQHWKQQDSARARAEVISRYENYRRDLTKVYASIQVGVNTVTFHSLVADATAEQILAKGALGNSCGAGLKNAQLAAAEWDVLLKDGVTFKTASDFEKLGISIDIAMLNKIEKARTNLIIAQIKAGDSIHRNSEAESQLTDAYIRNMLNHVSLVVGSELTSCKPISSAG